MRVDCTGIKARVLTMAAKPEGFAKRDLGDEQKSTVSRTVDRMVHKDGVLFVAFVHKNWVRYFDSAPRAAAYLDKAKAAYVVEKFKVTVTCIKAPDGPAVNVGEVSVQVLPGFTGAPKWAINGSTWRAKERAGV
jgi:hypothetical protein